MELTYKLLEKSFNEVLDYGFKTSTKYFDTFTKYKYIIEKIKIENFLYYISNEIKTEETRSHFTIDPINEHNTQTKEIKLNISKREIFLLLPITIPLKNEIDLIYEGYNGVLNSFYTKPIYEWENGLYPFNDNDTFLNEQLLAAVRYQLKNIIISILDCFLSGVVERKIHKYKLNIDENLLNEVTFPYIDAKVINERNSDSDLIYWKELKNIEYEK